MRTIRKKIIDLLGEFPVQMEWHDNSDLANFLISNGVTVQEWTPVSEPPKAKGCYFVTVLHWLDGNPVTREAYWNGADWLSCDRRHELTPRVTHWMPLPEPPKGD